MKMYEFSIIASGLDPQADDFEARFYNAGCDDATISFQKGHIIVDERAGYVFLATNGGLYRAPLATPVRIQASAPLVNAAV